MDGTNGNEDEKPREIFNLKSINSKGKVVFHLWRMEDCIHLWSHFRGSIKSGETIWFLYGTICEKGYSSDLLTDIVWYWNPILNFLATLRITDWGFLEKKLWISHFWCVLMRGFLTQESKTKLIRNCEFGFRYWKRNPLDSVSIKPECRRFSQYSITCFNVLWVHQTNEIW